MKPFVSIIVPIYNVEKHLHKCINSVLDQTYKNFELILVDDGSTDNSGGICNDYAKENNRIIVKHINNCGVSSARNLGIQNASGDWVLFLDGDDILETNSIEVIYKNVENNNNLGMLIGSFKYVTTSKVIYESNKNTLKKGINIICDYGLWKIKTCMGAFAVKKEILDKNHILFHTETKYGEDVEFINYCLVNSSSVLVTNQYLLNYIVHNESAIAKVSFDRFDCYEARNRTMQYIMKRFPKHKKIETLYKDYLLPEAIIDTIFLLCRHGVNIHKIINYLHRKKYYDVIERVNRNKNTPIELRNKINKFLEKPLLTWAECYLKSRYFYLRSNLGLLKRRIYK